MALVAVYIYIVFQHSQALDQWQRSQKITRRRAIFQLNATLAHNTSQMTSGASGTIIKALPLSPGYSQSPEIQ